MSLDTGILYFGVHAAIGAATAVAVCNPIGAAGGAMYGVCHRITHIVANVVVDRSRIKSVTASIFAFIGATAATWKLASLCGYGMSFKAALILGGLPIGVVVAASLVTGLGGIIVGTILYPDLVINLD